ncbi:MAG TPA: sulfotransferase domain-containing protein [Terriglobales bacterium]|nr:sulfotransferase domain-containing protein [Terriglobales bacterium]
MIYGVKFVLRYLSGLAPAGRNLAVYPDDTFIVSYPRSGNTWTRFLLANLLRPHEPVTFLNIEEIIPDAEALSNRRLKSVPRPRFIKTHEYFDHRYGNVIYIVRDPRDVVISYYHFQRKYRHIPDECPLDLYVQDFVHSRRVSGSWGNWGENVGSWLGPRMGTPRFLLLRYEDLMADTAAELTRVCVFLGIHPDPGLLQRAIENSSAEHLRELERVQGREWVSTRSVRPDIPFIRTAEVGGWQTQLTPDSVRAIESAWGDLMRRLGYRLSSEEAQSPSTAGTPPAREPMEALKRGSA